MTKQDDEIAIQNTLDFVEHALAWEYDLNGVQAALEALENIPSPRSIRLLIGFIESKRGVFSGQTMELCERAGRVMGKLTRELMERGERE